MISRQMFDKFAKPELEASAARLPHAFYHPDSLLTIDKIDGAQWVPGDGSPDCCHWSEVFKKIHASGKLIQIVSGRFDAINTVSEQIGTTRGLQYMGISGSVTEEKLVRERLNRYNRMVDACI